VFSRFEDFFSQESEAKVQHYCHIDGIRLTNYPVKQPLEYQRRQKGNSFFSSKT
jgi:hypothetical protein